MIKELLLFAAFIIASSMGFPADAKKNMPQKIVAIVPLDKEEMKSAETFYTGYSGYPTYGLTSHSGWRGDHQNGYGGGYGAAYGTGVGGGYVPAYGGGGYVGPYGGVAGVGTGIGGGYGWRNGPNRWAV